MQMYELNEILFNYSYHFRNELEMCRNLSYIIAQVNSTKKISPTDLMKFSWDNTSNNQSKPLTSADLQLFREKAKEIIRKNFTPKVVQ